MKVEWINPFLVATVDTFARMTKTKVSPGKPYLFTDQQNQKDISGVIGLSGSLKGAVVIGMPESVALAAVKRLIGTQYDKLTPEVSDAVGELANIIAGYAKKDITGEEIQIALPTVVFGPKHSVSMPSDVPVVVIPFESEMGSFVIEVGIRKVGE
ncbi:MAG TPA: chemotaxis protein CheX [Fibrobacteraceae bacterium]|nr:chemotaxis protein CheX [Fibrobacteraceae bacterium]